VSWIRNPFKQKPTAPPWDGKHTLRYILFEQFYGDQPSEYCSGWVWKCSCGTGTSLPFRGVYTEAEAAAEFVEHARIHADLLRVWAVPASPNHQADMEPKP
jgi:hypothetical protein